MKRKTLLSRRHADLRTALTLVGIAAVLALPYLTGLVMLDEGALVHIADRLASGEVLYRDVATGVMPGSYYLHALLFLLFGRSLLIGRIFMILLFASSAAGIFLLSRTATSRTPAFASALAFTALTVNFWRFPNYSPEAIALVLLALGAAAAYLRTRRDLWLFGAGAVLGMAFLFKQNYGLFAALGVVAGLAAAPVPPRRRLRDIVVITGIAAVPPMTVLALFAGAGALGDFWHDTVVVPLGLPATLFARPYPPLWGEPVGAMRQELLQYLPFQDLAYKMPRWLYTHMGLTMAAVRMLFYLPPVLFLLAAVAWFRRPGSPAQGPADRCRLVDHDVPADSQATKAAAANRALGMLYLATSIFLFLGVFPRVDAFHLVMVLAPSFVLVAWLVGPAPGRGVQSILMCVAVLWLALSITPQFVWKEFEPPWLQYAFLDLPRARIWMQDEVSANRMRHLVETVRQRIPPGEPVFIGPAEPMYYFLIDRPNPTRYPLILPGALDETEVIRDLETKQVRYALLSDFAFEQFTFEHVAPALWKYVTTHYGPADGASWEVAPLPPYLRRRGAVERQGMAEVRTARRGAGQAQGVGNPPPSLAPVSSITVDPSRWKGGWSLMRPSLSEPPLYRVEAREQWMDLQPERRVAWESTYLRQALVMRAPWGWRKVMATWEVPAEDGLAFEVSAALGPSAWGMPTVEGQGAIVEIWISPIEEGALPRRAWIRWLDPRRRPGDRRWFRVAVDLASFVRTPSARVTLVAGPAPTFDGSDAETVWAGMQLVRIHPGGGGGEVNPAASRPVLLDDAGAAKILAFDADDLAIFREAAVAYQSLPEAHTGLADVAASVGRHREALEAWKRAVGLNPANPVYRVRLGEALERVGQAEEAVAAMRAAVAIDPEEPNYHVALAALLLRLGRAEQSRRAVEEAFRRDPDHPWALTVLSALERDAKNYEAAAGAAKRAIVRQPESLRAHLDLVEALRGEGRIEEALAALERASALKLEASALNLEPGSRALVARGFLALGKPQRARTEAAAAITAAPTSFNAWATLGDAAAAAGDVEAAVDAWRQAVAKVPAPFGALLELGRALAAAGRSDVSLGALAAARREAGDNPSQHLELALAYARMGRPMEAAGEWKRVLALAPGGPLEEEARRHLKLEAVTRE